MTTELITVIFHHDNGTSWLRGIYTTFSTFSKEMADALHTDDDLEETMYSLVTVGKATITAHGGQYQIINCSLNEPCNLFING